MEKILQPLTDAEKLEASNQTQPTTVAPSNKNPTTPSPVLAQPSQPVAAPQQISPSQKPANTVAEQGQVALSGTSIYPQMGATNTTGNVPAPQPVTSSNIKADKVKIPLGLFVIVGVWLISAGSIFFQYHNSSLILSGSLLIGFLLSASLLLGFEIARLITLVFAVIAIITGSFNLIGLIGRDLTNEKNVTNLSQTIQQLPSTATAQQRANLRTQQAEASAENSALDKGIIIADAASGLAVVLCIAEAVYLTRPSVKSYFTR